MSRSFIPTRLNKKPVRLSFASAILLTSSVASAQNGTGLIFATPQQLLGIPIASMPYSGAQLPSNVDLSGDMPPPGDQGSQNSCVGWTVAYALKTYQEKTENKWTITSNGSRDFNKIFSPAFIYNQINRGNDAGAHFVDALKILSSQGAATWADMPYNANDYRSQPTQSATNNAKIYRIDHWRQVNVADVTEVKAQLAAQYPVVIGAMVDDGFYGLRSGQVWSGSVGQPRGGHAMIIVGYDDTKAAFKLLNSWGTSWGDNGFGWLSFSHFYNVVREGYVVKDAINGPPPPNPLPNPTPNPAPGPLPGPTPPSPASTAIAFHLTNVRHNINHPMLGLCMGLEGVVSVPPGNNGQLQVVVQFYLSHGGSQGPAVAATLPQFALPSGAAATGTPPITLFGQPFQQRWTAFIPYHALDVPRGVMLTPFGPSGIPIHTDLIAVPKLFIDKFNVGSGTHVPFWVKM